MNRSPLNAIQAIGYLSDVSQTHRETLTGFGKFIRLAEGERLINEGEAQDSLYLILSGTLQITTNADDRAVLLATLGEGDTIGEVSFFDPGTASANVTAVGECLVWGLDRAEIEELFESNPAAGIAVMKGLLRQAASRIRRMNAKLLTNEKEVFFDFWIQPEP